MSTDHTARLTPQELALKLACGDAVRAAGGQEFVGGEVGRRQSRISDYCSPNTAEFMPLNIALRIDQLGDGSPGHPHITRALNRALGQLAYDEAAEAGSEDWHLSQWLAEIAGESSDLLRLLAGGSLTPERAADSVKRMRPEERARLGREVDELIEALVGFNGLFADTS